MFKRGPHQKRYALPTVITLWWLSTFLFGKQMSEMDSLIHWSTMSWRNCTENQAPGQHLDHLLPEVAGNLLFRFLLCSLTWVTSLQTVGCIIFFSKWYPWKPKRVHVESFSNEFKMPERYDLWGSISTLHLVLEWCYVQQNDPPNAGREDYESYRYMIYIYRYIMYVDDSQHAKPWREKTLPLNQSGVMI